MTVKSAVILFYTIIWSQICLSYGISSRVEEQSRLLNDLLQKYDNRILPYGNNASDPSVVVNVDLQLLYFTGICDYNMDFGANFLLTMLWTDERLKYENRGYFLTLTDPSRFWVPDVFFTNEKDGQVHKVISPNTFYRIYPSGRVMYSTRLTLTLWCDMQFEKFPFDRQHCSINMTSYAYTTRDLRLVWKEESALHVSKAFSVLGFTLGSFETSAGSEATISGDYSSLSVNFSFRRDLEYYILHTFLPSSALVAVSWASFWMDKKAVLARNLLVLSTIFVMLSFSSDVEASVPNVPYVKAMDVWVATCFTFLLACLVEFAVVNAIEEEVSSKEHKDWEPSQMEKSTKDPNSEGKSIPRTSSITFYKSVLNHLPRDARRVDLAARVMFPATFLVFISLYICVFYIFDS